MAEWCRVAGFHALAQAIGAELDSVYQVRRGAAVSEHRYQAILAALATPPPPRTCATCPAVIVHHAPHRVYCDACVRGRAALHARTYYRRSGKLARAARCAACGAPEVREGRLVYCSARCCPPRFA